MPGRHGVSPKQCHHGRTPLPPMPQERCSPSEIQAGYVLHAQKISPCPKKRAALSRVVVTQHHHIADEFRLRFINDIASVADTNVMQCPTGDRPSCVPCYE